MGNYCVPEPFMSTVRFGVKWLRTGRWKEQLSVLMFWFFPFKNSILNQSFKNDKSISLALNIVSEAVLTEHRNSGWAFKQLQIFRLKFIVV